MNFFKKISFFIVFLNINYIFSQNNGGFENWTTSGSYQEPDSWQTFNLLSTIGNPVSAFQASGLDKYSGNYALKIKTIHLTNKLGINLPDTIGIVFNGKVIISPPSYKIGSPYTTRSEKLTFFSKYTPVGPDTGLVVVSLSRQTASGRDTIATGKVDVVPNGSYSYYEILLNYRSNATPDTAAIIFGSSKKTSTSRVGSTIFIDDVLFTGVVPIGIKENENSYQSQIKVYPTPANENITINTPFDEATKIEIINTLGQPIGTYKISNYITLINTNQFNNGVYFYNVYDKKNKLLVSGKINIVK